jgi:multidrug efflux pump subunit AcrB
MIELVKIALNRPYTSIVIALLIILFGPLAVLKSPTDIFPDIKIPVISAVWSYTGLPPEDMAGRVIYRYERALSSTVNDIDHIESQSLPGYGIVKIFFQPNVGIKTDASRHIAAANFELQRVNGTDSTAGTIKSIST